MANKQISVFGKKLEQALAEKKMTASQLSRKLKVAPPQIVTLKRTLKPRAKTLEKISKILGKPTTYWGVGSTVPLQTKNKAAKSASRTRTSVSSAKVYIIVELDGTEVSRTLLTK